jgi:rhodanese-related sulfurtransferase
LHKAAKFASSEEAAIALGVKVVDMRTPADFAKETLFDAQNVPFDSVKGELASPFDDVDVLENQWTEMKELLGREPARHQLTKEGGPIIAICYDGESSRVFTSILRACGVEAYSIKGGFPSVKAAQRYGSRRG